MPHMANLPWMEMYVMSNLILLMMSCLPSFIWMNKMTNINKSKKPKWTW